MFDRKALYLAVMALTLTCGSNNGEGTLTIKAYGESFIELGLPATAVDDGWAIEFERFVVHVDDVNVAHTSIDVANKVDLAKSSSGKGHELGSTLVAEGAHANGAYTLSKVEVKGSATKGEQEKTFEWVFDDPTRYEECETTTKVTDGGEATFEITVHADHLFYDSLVSDEPKVLFQALADADSDGDGKVTQQELLNTDIGDYDPGSDDGINDLWAWLSAQTRTLGHVDGEGHCHAKALK